MPNFLSLTEKIGHLTFENVDKRAYLFQLFLVTASVVSEFFPIALAWIFVAEWAIVELEFRAVGVLPLVEEQRVEKKEAAGAFVLVVEVESFLLEGDLEGFEVV